MHNIPSPQPVTEQAIAAISVAPRVTKADLDANIASEYYFTAAEGVIGAGAKDEVGTVYEPSLKLLTFCVLVLQNGYTVVGKSACASPANFNKQIGQAIARENAVEEVWGLMGYELRTRLSQGEKA